MSRNYWYSSHENNFIDNIKFLELHAGPEYLFQTKTASLNAVLFITLTLGLSFPILYPIALFSIIIQYIVERYTLAVFYRLPPKFSLDMTTWNIHILMLAPVYALSVIFWQLGNRQMFDNREVGQYDRLDETYQSHHTVGQVISQAVGFGLTAQEGIVLVAYVVISVAYSFVTILALIRPKNNLQFQEMQIPSYFDALREPDLEELVEEEQTLAYDFGIQNMSESNLAKADEILT